jgi:hypothetical protein
LHTATSRALPAKTWTVPNLGWGQINVKTKVKINGKIKIVCEYGAGGRAEWEVTCDDVGRD